MFHTVLLKNHTVFSGTFIGPLNSCNHLQFPVYKITSLLVATHLVSHSLATIKLAAWIVLYSLDYLRVTIKRKIILTYYEIHKTLLPPFFQININWRAYSLYVIHHCLSDFDSTTYLFFDFNNIQWTLITFPMFSLVNHPSLRFVFKTKYPPKPVVRLLSSAKFNALYANAIWSSLDLAFPPLTVSPNNTIFPPPTPFSSGVFQLGEAVRVFLAISLFYFLHENLSKFFMTQPFPCFRKLIVYYSTNRK